MWNPDDIGAGPGPDFHHEHKITVLMYALSTGADPGLDPHRDGRYAGSSRTPHDSSTRDDREPTSAYVALACAASHLDITPRDRGGPEDCVVKGNGVRTSAYGNVDKRNGEIVEVTTSRDRSPRVLGASTNATLAPRAPRRRTVPRCSRARRCAS